MNSRKIRIGTRGSALALHQAEFVAQRLRRLHDIETELVVIKTRGDKILDTPLSKIGGKGLFVKEIENALLAGKIDLAVHSLKDMPVQQPAGLTLAAFLERADPRDALISRNGNGLSVLRKGAIVGTSSLRRVAQLRYARSDLRFVPLRGNVDTRLRKLHQGEADAIVLAAAGLLRLGKETVMTERLTPDICVPAAGQGILCVETKKDDLDIHKMLEPLDSRASRTCALAERRVVGELGGGCQIPIGALAEIAGPKLRLTCVVSDLEGERLIRVSAHGKQDEAAGVADKALAQLRQSGVEELLSEIVGSGGGP